MIWFQRAMIVGTCIAMAMLGVCMGLLGISAWIDPFEPPVDQWTFFMIQRVATAGMGVFIGLFISVGSIAAIFVYWDEPY